MPLGIGYGNRRRRYTNRGIERPGLPRIGASRGMERPGAVASGYMGATMPGPFGPAMSQLPSMAMGPNSYEQGLQQRMQNYGRTGTLRSGGGQLSDEELIQQGANPYEVRLRRRSLGTPTPQLSDEELLQRGASPYEVNLRRRQRGTLGGTYSVNGQPASGAAVVNPNQYPRPAGPMSPNQAHTGQPYNPIDYQQPLGPGALDYYAPIQSNQTPIVQQAIRDSDMRLGTSAAMRDAGIPTSRESAMNQGHRFYSGGRGTGLPREHFMERADAALSGVRPAPNEEHPLLGPQLPIIPGRPGLGERVVPGSMEEIQSGALRQRVPAGTTMSGGSTIAYRPDGSPVLLPPGQRTFTPPLQRAAAEESINQQLMDRYAVSGSPTERAGRLGLAYKPPQRDNQQATGPSSIGAVRERRRELLANRSRRAGFGQENQTFARSNATNRPLAERQASLGRSMDHPSVASALGDIDPLNASVNDIVSGYASSSGNFSNQDTQAYKKYVQDRYSADENFRKEMDEWLSSESKWADPNDPEQLAFLDAMDELRKWFGRPPVERGFLDPIGTYGGF